MANLSVRKLDDQVVARLRLRAAAHGVSMEEEVRRIIEQAVSAPARVGDIALDIFGEAHGVDLEPVQHPPHSAIDLSS